MPRYKNDPRWIRASFDSTCSRKGCAKPIKKGEDVFYYPSSRTCYCKADDCGGQASRDFDAAAQDEAFMSGGW